MGLNARRSANVTKPIRLTDSSGEVLARDNVVMAFFRKCPFSDMADGVMKVFEKYFEVIPQNVLQWSIIGMSAETFTPVNKQALTRCASMLKKDAAKKKDAYFQLMGPQKWMPDYCWTITGRKEPEKAGFLDQTNVVEMVFPREFLSTCGEDDFVQLANDLFVVLRSDSGYGSVALYCNESAAERAGALIVPLALRSRRFDIPNNSSTASFMGSRCRGARWLTMLSTELADQVGGLKAFKQKLPKEVTIHESPKGVLLQSGQTPANCRVNPNKANPALPFVGHLNEKIPYVHHNTL